jgi:hypothetical protein
METQHGTIPIEFLPPRAPDIAHRGGILHKSSQPGKQIRREVQLVGAVVVVQEAVPTTIDVPAPSCSPADSFAAGHVAIFAGDVVIGGAESPQSGHLAAMGTDIVVLR